MFYSINELTKDLDNYLEKPDSNLDTTTHLENFLDSYKGVDWTKHKKYSEYLAMFSLIEKKNKYQMFLVSFLPKQQIKIIRQNNIECIIIKNLYGNLTHQSFYKENLIKENFTVNVIPENKTMNLSYCNNYRDIIINSDKRVPLIILYLVKYY